MLDPDITAMNDLTADATGALLDWILDYDNGLLDYSKLQQVVKAEVEKVVSKTYDIAFMRGMEEADTEEDPDMEYLIDFGMEDPADPEGSDDE